MKALHVTQGAALLAKLEHARRQLEIVVGCTDVIGIDDLTLNTKDGPARITADPELVERLVAVIMAEVLKVHRTRVRELRAALISLGVELDPDPIIKEAMSR